MTTKTKTKTKTDTDADFLALAFGRGMSWYARSSDREKAIRRCARQVRATARRFGSRKRFDVHMSVYDMSGTGIDNVWWDYREQPFVDDKPLSIKPEFVTA